MKYKELKNKFKNKYVIRVAAGVLTIALLGTGVGMYSVHAQSNNKNAAEETISLADTDDEEKEDVLTKVLDSQVSREDSEAGKEETVYVVADASGRKQEVIVSEWLKNAEGAATIEDATDLKDIKNVKGNEEYTENADGTITWKADGKDIYYQGKTDKELPVEMKISYTLDGEEISAEELAGKSGKVTIRMDYTNKETMEATINGKKEEVSVPFTAVSGMILSDKFSNVKVTNGKLISDGKNQVVVGVAMPGLSDSLKVDSKDFDTEVDIPEYVEVSADVEDFSLDMTMTMIMSDVLADLQLDKDLDLSEIEDAIDTMTDASGKLVDGSGELAEGLGTLKDNMGEYANGVNTLKDGVNSYTDGASQVNDGISTLKNGTGALTDGAGTLADGVSKISDTFTDEKGLKNGAKALADGASSLKTGLNSYTDGTSQLNDGISTLKNGADALVGGAGTLADGVSKISDSFTGEKGLKNGAKALADGAKDLKKGLGSYTDGAAQLNDGIATLKNGAGALASGAGTLADGVSKINDTFTGENGLKNGAKAVADGVSQLDKALNTEMTEEDKQKVAAQADEAVDKSFADGGVADKIASGVSSSFEQIMDDKKADISAQLGEALAPIQAQMVEAIYQKEIFNAYQENKEAIDLMINNGLASNITEAIDADGNIYVGVEAAVAAQLNGTAGEMVDELVSGVTAQSGVIGANVAATCQETAKKAAEAAAVSGAEGAKAQIAAQIEQGGLVAGAGALSSGVNKLYEEGISPLKQGVDSMVGQLPTLTGGIQQLSDGSTTLIANNKALKDGAQQLVDGTAQISGGVNKLYKEGISPLKQGVDSMVGQLPTLTGGIQQLSDGSSTLIANNKALKDGAQQLVDGTAQISGGVNQLYEEGISPLKQGVDSMVGQLPTLTGGIQQLSDGSAALVSNNQTLKDGAKKLSDATSQITDGVNKLQDGSNQLAEGLAEFDEEGIQKLADTYHGDVQTMLDRIDAVMDAGKSYHTFTKLSDGVDGSVKFIIRTDAIEAE